MAYVQNIFAHVGLGINKLVLEKSDNNIFSKGLVYKNRGGKVFAEIGILNDKVLKKFDIEQTIFYADIYWDNVTKAVKKETLEYQEISKFPAVSRDLALLIDNNVEFEQIEQIALQTEKKLLKSVDLFDVYEGKNLPAGKKSYAINFILQDDTKTLNEKAIDAIMQKLIKQLCAKLNAELR